MEVLIELGYFCGQRSYAEVARAQSWRWLLLKEPERQHIVRRREQAVVTVVIAADATDETRRRSSRRHKKRHAQTREDNGTSIY